MSVYAIGDIQGCLEDLQRLLDHIKFDPESDELWFAGDLVNRGPHSLETLRFVQSLGKRAITVLGNHDLHLLAAAYCPARKYPDDTLRPVLEAPDRDDLLDWLRHQPLLHHDAKLGYTMVHAGLPPQWDLHTAISCAAEVESQLRSDLFEEFLKEMYGNKPKRWKKSLKGYDRLRFITNCLTRLRYCSPEGKLDLKEKGPPGSQKPPNIPWFEVPKRANKNLRILFGHWSTLGKLDLPGIYPLDTGCLWGGELTALRLAHKAEWLRIPCSGIKDPKDFI